MGRVKLVNVLVVNDLGGILGGTPAGVGGRGGSSEDNPLPSGLCVFSVPVLILKYFPCQLKITLCTPRAGIVHQDRFPMTGSFRESNAPGDDCCQDVALEEVS